MDWAAHAAGFARRHIGHDEGVFVLAAHADAWEYWYMRPGFYVHRLRKLAFVWQHAFEQEGGMEHGRFEEMVEMVAIKWTDDPRAPPDEDYPQVLWPFPNAIGGMTKMDQPVPHLNSIATELTPAELNAMTLFTLEAISGVKYSHGGRVDMWHCSALASTPCPTDTCTSSTVQIQHESFPCLTSASR